MSLTFSLGENLGYFIKGGIDGWKETGESVPKGHCRESRLEKEREFSGDEYKT